MKPRRNQLLLTVSLLLGCHALTATDRPPEPKLATKPSPACIAAGNFFVDEVWAKVGERTCWKCHRAAGDASDTRFVLRRAGLQRSALDHNLAAFARMARTNEGGTSRLLLKASGDLDHGGGRVLAPSSSGYQILERFARKINGRADKTTIESVTREPEFFAGVEMLEPGRLLRRVTLSLAGRLPSPEEQANVADRGLDAMPSILAHVMREEAFYERLKEGFNDIFLTVGYDGNGEEVLSYNHFEKTRLWYQKHDLSAVQGDDARQRAR